MLSCRMKMFFFNKPYRLGTYLIVWILQLPGSKLYWVCEFNDIFILNQTEPFTKFALLIETFGQWMDRHHPLYMACNVYCFLLVQSMISLIGKHWLCWLFVLGSNLLHSSHFVKVLHQKHFITTLSEDRVPIVETPAHIIYMTFWDITIYSDTLYWSHITPISEHITELGRITDFDLVTKFWEVSIEHYNGCG